MAPHRCHPDWCAVPHDPSEPDPAMACTCGEDYRTCRCETVTNWNPYSGHRRWAGRFIVHYCKHCGCEWLDHDRAQPYRCPPVEKREKLPHYIGGNEG